MSDESLIPYLRRRNREHTGTAGRRSEKRVAKEVGGRQTIASGAIEGAKGDIELPDVLMEAKSTVKNSVSIKFDWLSKITGEARSQGKIPALSVSFTTPTGARIVGGDWVMVPMAVWKEHFGGGQ